MARGHGGPRLWGYPAFGLGMALGVTLVPGQPLALESWPVGGAFGAFTWAAFVVAGGFALTLLLLAAVLLRRRKRGAGRALAVSGAFGVLAASSYGAAARYDLLEAHPAPALGLTLAAVVALGALSRRLDGAGGEAAGVEGAPAARLPWVPVPALVRLLVVFAVIYGGLWALAATGLLGKVLGPTVGDVLTVTRPVTIFWTEAGYFAEAARREGAGDPPPPDGRKAVLPVGARVEVKGWIDAGGAEVRVGHDPGGRLEGEWGYLHPGDLAP